jgi:hypothetical protein
MPKCTYGPVNLPTSPRTGRRRFANRNPTAASQTGALRRRALPRARNPPRRAEAQRVRVPDAKCRPLRPSNTKTTRQLSHVNQHRGQRARVPVVEPAPLGHFLPRSEPERAFLVYLGSSQWVCGVGVVKNHRHFARSGFDILDHDISGCHSSQTSPTNGEATTLNRPRPRDAASPRKVARFWEMLLLP